MLLKCINELMFPFAKSFNQTHTIEQTNVTSHTRFYCITKHGNCQEFSILCTEHAANNTEYSYMLYIILLD